MRIVATLALALLLGGCHASREDCTQLLDHFIDVEGAAATSTDQFVEMTPPLQHALAESKARHKEQIGERFVASCQKLLSPREARCALAAADEAGMDHCEGR